MGQVIPFSIPESAAFDDETTAFVVRAYERACAELHDTGQPPVVREVIAKRLIEIAGRGERDIEVLCRVALTSLGLTTAD
jgi:predicted Ser/Thr protein kinase